MFLQDDRDIFIVEGPKLNRKDQLDIYDIAARMTSYFRRWMGKQPTDDIKFATISVPHRKQTAIVISADKTKLWKENAYAALLEVGYGSEQQAFEQKDVQEYMSLKPRTWNDASYLLCRFLWDVLGGLQWTMEQTAACCMGGELGMIGSTYKG